MELDPNTDLYWQTEGRQFLPPDWDEEEFLRLNAGIPERGKALFRRMAIEDWLVERDGGVLLEP